jgi:hypothetical protein
MVIYIQQNGDTINGILIGLGFEPTMNGILTIMPSINMVVERIMEMEKRFGKSRETTVTGRALYFHNSVLLKIL